MSTKGDAKGVINIGDDKIGFYESTAALGKVTLERARAIQRRKAGLLRHFAARNDGSGILAQRPSPMLGAAA